MWHNRRHCQLCNPHHSGRDSLCTGIPGWVAMPETADSHFAETDQENRNQMGRCYVQRTGADIRMQHCAGYRHLAVAALDFL